MNDLSLMTTESIVAELKQRNISFVIAYIDHNELNKTSDGVVWACDAGGNLPLKLTCLRLLNEWMEKVTTRKLAESEEPCP